MSGRAHCPEMSRSLARAERLSTTGRTRTHAPYAEQAGAKRDGGVLTRGCGLEEVPARRREAQRTDVGPVGSGRAEDGDHEGDMARSGDRRKRSNPRGGRLPVLPAGSRPDGSAPAGPEDGERSG